MPASEPTWTEERLERLKSRFAAGLTCREIAGDLGVSRNAVIGKLSRLKLTREKSGDPRPSERKDAAKRRIPKTVPRLQYQMLKAVYGEKPDQRVFIRGDKAINYGRMMEVMGVVIDSGFRQLGLLGEQAQGAPAKPAGTVTAPGPTTAPRR